NPGIPATNVVGGGGNTPWQAASFIRNLGGPFARGFSGYRTIATSSKGWQSSWESPRDSADREAWWIDPANNGFMTTVNGHVLWDGQWDNWNSGKQGWAS